MLKLGISIFAYIVFITIILLVQTNLIQTKKQNVKLLWFIIATVIFFLLEILSLLYPTIKTIIKVGIDNINIDIWDKISCVIAALEFAFSIYIENNNNNKQKDEHNNLFFDELSISNPCFDNSRKTEFKLIARKNVLPKEYHILIETMTIYVILVKELLEDETIFNKYKDDEQYVRKICLNNIKLDLSDIERTNVDTYYRINKYDGSIIELKDILKNNAIKFEDKTMIRTICNYKLINSPSKITGKVEKILVTLFHRFDSTAIGIFKMESCYDNHYLYCRPEKLRGKNGK